jgi:hypothetical protein
LLFIKLKTATVFMENTKTTCKYCMEEITAGAKVCPHCKKDLRNWFVRHYIVSILLVIFIGIPVIAGLINGDKPTPTSTTSSESTAVDELHTWRYTETEDAMTSKTTTTATVGAKDELMFDFPYNGGSIAQILLRNKNGRNDVMLIVSKGQFNSSINDNYVKIRFDDTPAKTYSYGRPSDGSSDTIFLNSTAELIAKMKTSKKVIIEAEFFQEGLKQMEFNVSGLKWDF